MLPVRDCIGSIEGTIKSLVSQSLPCSRINVVDDGSTDGTGQALDRMAARYDILNVIHKDSQTRDYSRLPRWWNEMLEKNHYDYFMITGGDIMFGNDYAERILSRMDMAPDCVIASGIIHDGDVAPSGAGRFVKASWFFRHYERFPEIVGYESEMLERASMCGYTLDVFSDCRIEHAEETGHSHGFSEYGSAMRSLGYYPPFALMRCVLSPLQRTMPVYGAARMLWYYLKFRQDGGYYSLFDAKLREHVRNKQKAMVTGWLRKKLSRQDVARHV